MIAWNHDVIIIDDDDDEKSYSSYKYKATKPSSSSMEWSWAEPDPHPGTPAFHGEARSITHINLFQELEEFTYHRRYKRWFSGDK